MLVEELYIRFGVLGIHASKEVTPQASKIPVSIEHWHCFFYLYNLFVKKKISLKKALRPFN